MLLNNLKSLLMDLERLPISLAVMERKKGTLNNSYSNIVLLRFIKDI